VFGVVGDGVEAAGEVGACSLEASVELIYLRTAPWLANLEDCLFNAIG